ncbi:MAG: transposase [Bauldia sp.]
MRSTRHESAEGTCSRIRFEGILQVDGYPGFEKLGADIRLAACWAHARREFYEVHQATASPIAAEALRCIAEFYAIEATIRGKTAATQQNMRQSSSLQLVTAMKAWLELQFTRIPPRGGLAEAIRYALTRWDALCCWTRAVRGNSSSVRVYKSGEPHRVDRA